MSTVLITGGTGSLGQALTKKLLYNLDVDKIIIYSRDEHKQEKMARKLKSPKLRFFLGDVRDKERLNTAMEGVDYVLHTAALKIVPAMEYNPQEAVKTNIIGTQNVLECGGRVGVYRIITVSTDKAVHPLNLYGATKLCAEKLTIASAHLYPDTSFCVARYGNVALSNGSVIPLFQDWHAKGKPLEITSNDMTRFWITLNEAAQFVVDRLFDPYKKANSVIYIPDMPAYHMDQLSAIFSTKGVENKIIGIRPGEKIHEAIVTDSEVGRSVKMDAYTIIHPEWGGDFEKKGLDVLSATRSNTARRMDENELSQRIHGAMDDECL